MQNDNFGAWAILELMGHTRIAGYITEEEHFGTKIGRIDIPTSTVKGSDGFVTQYFGSAIYRITPVSERVARMFAARNQPRPVYIYELQLPEICQEATEYDNSNTADDKDDEAGPAPRDAIGLMKEEDIPF